MIYIPVSLKILHVRAILQIDGICTITVDIYISCKQHTHSFIFTVLLYTKGNYSEVKEI